MAGHFPNLFKAIKLGKIACQTCLISLVLPKKSFARRLS